MILGVSYKHIAIIAGISAALIYASNNRLPVVGNSVRSLLGG